MTNPDRAIESAIVAAGANVAPRVTPADIAENIASEHYFTALDGARFAPAMDKAVARVRSTFLVESESHDSLREAIALRVADVGKATCAFGEAPPQLDLLTFCVLVLRNGFTVTGESACASPENYNKAIGERIARENAVAKIWPLLGFALKERMYAEGV